MVTVQHFAPWAVPAVLYPPSLVVDYSVFYTNDSLVISESTSFGGVVSIKPWFNSHNLREGWYQLNLFNSHNLRGGDTVELSSHLLLVWYIEGLKSSEWRFNESS